MISGNPTLYVAGPMSWMPQFNIPAFDKAAKSLRERGYTVRSPAELDNKQVRETHLASPDGAPGKANATWGDFLSRDVKLIADEVDVVVVLQGWQKSRGARLETFVAYQLCGMPVVYYPSLLAVPEMELLKAWVGDWFDQDIPDAVFDHDTVIYECERNVPGPVVGKKMVSNAPRSTTPSNVSA